MFSCTDLETSIFFSFFNSLSLSEFGGSSSRRGRRRKRRRQFTSVVVVPYVVVKGRETTENTFHWLAQTLFNNVRRHIIQTHLRKQEQKELAGYYQRARLVINSRCRHPHSERKLSWLNFNDFGGTWFCPPVPIEMIYFIRTKVGLTPSPKLNSSSADLILYWQHRCPLGEALAA